MSEKYLGQEGLSKLIELTKSEIATKQDVLVSGTNIKTLNNESLLGAGNIDINATPMVETTWAELKALRDGAQLIPGMQYRITDYVTTTAQTNTSSAGHQFDVIVVADAVDKLNENARAALHAGDTYFANNKLEAWELKYCLDNDTTRFQWAKSSGTGVIFWMRDEFANEVPYDFKNILFTKSGVYTNVYTFNYGSSRNQDASLIGITEATSSRRCYSNIIRATVIASDGKLHLSLNQTVFSSSSEYYQFHGNVIGEGNRDNFFNGSGSIYGNIIGNDFVLNTFGNQCYHNVIGNNFSQNTIGSQFYRNIIGNSFYHNTIGSNFTTNQIGNSFSTNVVGNYFTSNVTSSGVVQCLFGSMSSIDVYIRKCVFESMQYIDLSCADTDATSSNQLQFVHIHAGLNGTDANNRITITVPDRNLSYAIDYYATGSQEIII